jgi:hypothetical protein
MQVTPETARQPGYGIRPWNGKDQTDLARVGRQKLAALNGKYGGDTDKVLAAYNWGEGNLDRAIKKYGDDWYSHAPHETQNYVANGARQPGEGGSVGGPVRSMESEDIASALGNKQAEDLQDLASVTQIPDDNIIQGRFGHPFETLQDQIDAVGRSGETHPRTKWDGALDQLEANYKAGRISEEEFDAQLNRIGRQFSDESQSQNVLTPAERQDMDASVPTQPVDNTGYEKYTPYVEEPPAPANDVEGKSPMDLELENRVNTPENIAGAKDVWDKAHEDYMSQFQQPDDYNSALIRQRGGTGRKFTMSPDDFQAALDHADEAVHKYWQDKVDTAKADLDKEGFGSGGQEPPNEPPSGGDGTGPTDGGEEPPVSRSDEELTDKLALTVKNAKPLREQQESLYHKERSKRLKAMQDAAKMTSGEDRVRARLSALGGDLPKVDYEGVRGQFSQEEINRLNDIIEEHPRLGDFDKVHAEAGLKKLLEGSVPTHGELRLLAEAFPDKVIKAILDKREFGEKFNDFILNASSASRALRASGDLSAPLRQGINLIGTKAFWKSFFTMFKSMGKEGFEAVQNEIASRPTFPLMQRSGLAITKVSRILDDREEMFLSTWAEKLPHVKYSERAYIAFLNKLRADTFDSLVKQSYAAGIDFRESPKALKDIATYVNNATGRGSLGQLAGSYKLLNATLFAPRLMASRAKMLTWFFNPSFYTTLNPVVRRAYISNMIKMGGIVGTAVGLAKMGGLGVDVDPRSSDFGKVKVGNTRFDPWGGYQQYVRLASVLVAGEKVSPTTGAVTSLTDGKFGHGTRFDAVVDFLRNKESPMASIVDDLLSLPKDRFGQKITPTKEAINLFVPMVEEDIRQAWQDNHAAGIAAGPAAMFGVGVQTYQPKEPKTGTKDPFSDPALWGGASPTTKDPFSDPSIWSGQ